MKERIERIPVSFRDVLFVILVIFGLATAKTLKGQTVSTVQAEVAKYEIAEEHQKIIVAQFVLESDWGKSGWSKKFHNIFGLTKYDRTLKRRVPQVFNDWEHCVKNYYTQIYSKWARYDGDNYYDFLFDLPYATGDVYVDKLKTLVKQIYG